MAEGESFPSWLRNLRESMGLTRARMSEETGLSANYLYQLESGSREPSDSARKLFDLIDRSRRANWPAAGPSGPEADRIKSRLIPVVSWAHAGEAESFEELPSSWQDLVPTECRDPKAFAVRLIGDSMMPQFNEGDLLVVQPSTEVYSGCLAVVRLANDGVVFRRIELRKDVFRLIPLNPQYTAEEISRADVAWAYPLWGMWRQVWK